MLDKVTAARDVSKGLAVRTRNSSPDLSSGHQVWVGAWDTAYQTGTGVSSATLHRPPIVNKVRTVRTISSGVSEWV